MTTLYCLEFPNGKKYIGLATDLARRCQWHRHAALRGVDFPLYRAMRKYGFPQCRVLCLGDPKYIADLEIKAIATFRCREACFGYNVCLGGDLSPMATPAVRAKVKGRVKSALHRARLSAAHKGRRKSREHCASLSAAHKKPTGREVSSGTRARIAASERGKVVSDATRGKQSRSARLRPKRTLSPETRARISAALMGHPVFTRSAAPPA